ncbi:MAG: hypothetical protein SGPRY_013811, partial [Prymnesium sp.]
RPRLEPALLALRSSERAMLASDDPTLLLMAERAHLSRWQPGSCADVILHVSDSPSPPPPAAAPLLYQFDRSACSRLLEESAYDCECRMQSASLAAEAQLGAEGSVFDLAARLVEECTAAGLARRHAARLALEATLSSYASEETVKSTASHLFRVMAHCAAANDLSLIPQLLDILEGEGLGVCALNVTSVLVFLHILPATKVEEWCRAEPRVPEWALPLLGWMEKQREQEPLQALEEITSGGSNASNLGKEFERNDRESSACSLPTGSEPKEVPSSLEEPRSSVAEIASSTWEQSIQPVRTHSCDWDPKQAAPVINAQAADRVATVEGDMTHTVARSDLDSGTS